MQRNANQRRRASKDGEDKKKHMDNTSEKWMNALIRIRLLRGLKGMHRSRTKNKLLETSH